MGSKEKQYLTILPIPNSLSLFSFFIHFYSFPLLSHSLPLLFSILFLFQFFFNSFLTFFFFSLSLSLPTSFLPSLLPSLFPSICPSSLVPRPSLSLSRIRSFFSPLPFLLPSLFPFLLPSLPKVMLLFPLSYNL